MAVYWSVDLLHLVAVTATLLMVHLPTSEWRVLPTIILAWALSLVSSKHEFGWARIGWFEYVDGGPWGPEGLIPNIRMPGTVLSSGRRRLYEFSNQKGNTRPLGGPLHAAAFRYSYLSQGFGTKQIDDFVA